jgi:hypothetical protein
MAINESVGVTSCSYQGIDFFQVLSIPQKEPIKWFRSGNELEK